ncbi:MAG TPA: winged helix-turn-helix domain-containing protein, partial [Burkholderiaceae bacterium]|nr:winged helix-turn-helix domain-containing protein [Burkholderiaceae bacterium]
PAVQEHYPFPTSMRIGDWMIDSATGLMSRDGKMAMLQADALRLLVRLAQAPGTVVSVEELLQAVWPGSDVTPDAVHEAVGDLRIALGDDPVRPIYIATVRRKGYRLTARVSDQNTCADTAEAAPARRKIPARWWQAGVALLLVAAVTAAVLLRPAPEIPRTVGVMPFIDLTDAVARDPFANTVTEELIGRLTKVPGLGVAPPASSMRYRGNPVAFGEFANALQVAYVVDGSMRKSRGMLTFAARLTRASDGEVVLTRNYERKWDERTAILDEVAADIGAVITTPAKK